MADTYEIGGILKVLHTSNAKEDKSSEGEEEERCGSLMNLFTFPTETEETGNQHIVSEEIVNEIINGKGDVDEQDDVNKETKLKKKKKQKDSSERLERTLFVGNVALNITKKTLQKLFLKFGEIENLRFRSFTAADTKIPKKVVIIKKAFHTECKSMNAYIVYKCKDSISKALTCNGMVLEGLHLRVDKVSTEKEHKNKQSLFLGNLPFNIDEEAVYKHFEQCGTIDNVRLVRDKSSGMGKGIGYVTFKNSDGVVFGLKLNGSKLNGRAIRVCRSDNSPKNQYNNRNVKNNQNFCGLKSTTSKRDRELGKKLVQEKIHTSKNAMRRIKNKVGTNKHGKINKKIFKKR